MMTPEVEVEERLAASMRDHVAGISLDGDVLTRAGKRHQRRKVVRRSGFGAVALAVAAVAGFGMANGIGGSAPGSLLQPAIYLGDEGSQARLVAAITASQATSYRVTLTVEDVFGAQEKGKKVSFSGAYDPASDSGYLRSGNFEERLVNGVHYMIIDGNGFESPKSKVDGLLYEWPGGHQFLGVSVDPQMMLDSMRRRDAKVTETGNGVFHFEMTVARQDPRGKTTIAINGDVTVGADNRVAKVDYTSQVDGPISLHIKTSMEFTDYGAPVRVEKP